MKPDELDQGDDLGLRTPQPKRSPPTPQTPREHRKVEHERGVGEVEAAEVDDDVGLGRQRANESAPSEPLGAPILVA